MSDRVAEDLEGGAIPRATKFIPALAAAALLTGAAIFALLDGAERHRTEVFHIDGLTPTGRGPLDGLVFGGMLGPAGKPKDVEDVFVFEGGTFVSKECELRCDYPARPYEATRTESGWSFTSTTRCPYKDATIVWTGTVTGDRISGVATWTMRRWYWTQTRDFTFEARLGAAEDISLTSN